MHQYVYICRFFYVNGDFQPVQVGFVPYIRNVLQLAGFHQSENFVYDRFNICGIGDFQNFNAAVLSIVLVFCPQLHAAAAGFVDAFQFLPVIDQQTARRKIRCKERFAKVDGFVLDKTDCRFAEFGKVEAANRACHAYGDAEIRVCEDIGKGCGQECWLLHGIIIVIDKIHSVFIDIRKNLVADRCQLDFCIPRRGVCHIA